MFLFDMDTRFFMNLTVDQIANLEDAILTLYSKHYKFPFATSLALVRNRKRCKEVTDLFFSRCQLLFSGKNELTEEEKALSDALFATVVEIEIEQVYQKDLIPDGGFEVEPSVIEKLSPMIRED